jgi:cobalt-zinc-cadmium efflux system protein
MIWIEQGTSDRRGGLPESGALPADGSGASPATAASGRRPDDIRAAARIRFAFFLNFLFSALEIAGGLWTNSIAILADAVHDVGDCFALGAAWHLERLSARAGDERYSYGYRRFSLLGALISAAILVAGSLLVLSEAVPRLVRPERSDAPGMVAFAVVGVLVNGAATLRLRGERGLNARIVAWHLIEDTLGWLAILGVSVVLLFKDIPALDPALSLVITLYVLYNVAKNIRRTAFIFLEGAPEGVDLAAIERELEVVEGVRSTHHTHVWSLDGIHHVFTCHVSAVPGVTLQGAADIKRRIRNILGLHGIAHTTIEIECADDSCAIVDADCRSAARGGSKTTGNS